MWGFPHDATRPIHISICCVVKSYMLGSSLKKIENKEKRKKGRRRCEKEFKFIQGPRWTASLSPSIEEASAKPPQVLLQAQSGMQISPRAAGSHREMGGPIQQIVRCTDRTRQPHRWITA